MTTISVAFYGAGGAETGGNPQFWNFCTTNGVSEACFYTHRGGTEALKDILEAIDGSKNGYVSKEEIASYTLRIFGYSWGAIAAIGLAQKLSRAGELHLGMTPKTGPNYYLEAPVSVDLLFTIDPVKILNPPGVVPKNVDLFRNYYQRNAKPGIGLDETAKVAAAAALPNLGQLLNGTKVESKAADTRQVKLDKTICLPAPWQWCGDNVDHVSIVGFVALLTGDKPEK